MKNFIFILIIVMLLSCFTGCKAKPANTTESTDFYAIEKTQDYLRLVYTEQNFSFWVCTLDNTVWIAYGANDVEKMTRNGQDIIWQGSMESTLTQNEINGSEE